MLIQASARQSGTALARRSAKHLAGLVARLREKLSGLHPYQIETVRLRSNVEVVPAGVALSISSSGFASLNNFQFPILSDYWPHGDTCQRYGCFNETTGVPGAGASSLIRTVLSERSSRRTQLRSHASTGRIRKP